MEDLASMCERQFRKACNPRSAAEELEETGSNGRASRHQKRGSPKPAAEARAMETDPSPVRLWSAADSEEHSDGYPFGVRGDGQTAHKGAHGPPNPVWSMTPRRWRGLPDPERRLWPGKRSQRGIPWAIHPWRRSPRRLEPCYAPNQVEGTLSATASTYPKMGMDAIVQHLNRLDNQRDGLGEDIGSGERHGGAASGAGPVPGEARDGAAEAAASGGQPPPPGGGHVRTPETARGVTTPRLGSGAPGKAGNGRAGGAG